MTGSFLDSGNQYIHLVSRFLYSKLLIVGKQLPAFPHTVWDLNGQTQRWEVTVLPLCHHGPSLSNKGIGKFTAPIRDYTFLVDHVYINKTNCASIIVSDT